MQPEVAVFLNEKHTLSCGLRIFPDGLKTLEILTSKIKD